MIDGEPAQQAPSPGSRLLEGQHNAPYQPAQGCMMRIGVPHRSGSLAFHAFDCGYPVMVSASAFWDRQTRTFRVPSATDLDECDVALDSAGFTALAGFRRAGAQPGMLGVFPWTLQQYMELASEISPSWVAQPDLTCEPELAASDAERLERVQGTALLLECYLRQLYAWQDELARRSGPIVAANMLAPPVPVLQGWTVEDYLLSLELMLKVWRRWEPWLAPPQLIGLGSVCRRHLHHPEHGLYRLLEALEGRLPAVSRLHLFGVKGAALQRVRDLPWVASCDSMAYDVNSRRAAWKERRTNSMAHRKAEMSRWMAAALDVIQPT